MTDAAANSAAPAAAEPAAEKTSAKVVQLRAAVQEGAGALNDWAQDQAKMIGAAAKEKPMTAIGVSAGAAFAAGLVLGLLLVRPSREPTWKERLMELRPEFLH
jgi:ElaB/YqjD/DUF883 family membrane-anchored ribosome-binding protein